MSQECGPNGQPLMHEAPQGERKCLHCRRETEDGIEVELTKRERRGPDKAAWLCELCNDDRKSDWKKWQITENFEDVCDSLGISNELEPIERGDRADDKIKQLLAESTMLRELLTAMSKAGTLLSAVLDENPYCFFENQDGAAPYIEHPLTQTMRKAVQMVAPDPAKWEIDQLTKRALSARRILVDLYSQRAMYESGNLGYRKNLWAIPHLEALRDRTEEQIEKLMSKLP